MEDLWERLLDPSDGSSSSFSVFTYGYLGLLFIFRGTDLQHKQPGGGELVPTQGIYNATTKIVTVSQDNNCIKVFLVLPLKDKKSN